MPNVRPFRFGAHPRGICDRRTLREHARAIESMGYDIFLVPDHVDGRLAPMLALAAAAEATSRLKVGTMVLANDIRRAVLLANEAITLQILSSGRFELGIGTGWLGSDYAALNVPIPNPALRVAALEDSVATLRTLFRQSADVGACLHEARADSQVVPLPPGISPPPLCIGGSGQRILTFAGAAADVVSMNLTFPNGTLDRGALLTGLPTRYDERVAAVRHGSRDRAVHPELHSMLYWTAVGAPSRVLDEPAGRFGLSERLLRTLPVVAVGSVDEVCELLEMRRKRWGISYWSVYDPYGFAPVVERLAGR